MSEKNSKDAPFVAYNPELDISSCGPTETKARENLHEAVAILLDEIHKKGMLSAFLEESGFQRINKSWIPPVVSFESFAFPFAI